MDNIIKTINVSTAIDIFDQSRSEDDNFLVEKLSFLTNIDAGTINKHALISKLYRYKSKLKAKRGNAKTDFERETFALPTQTTQAPKKGKFVDDEIACYKEACTSFALELKLDRQKSNEEIECLKENHSSNIHQMQKEFSTHIKGLKRTHSKEMERETKKLKITNEKCKKQILLESNQKEKTEQKLKSVLKSKQEVSYKKTLLQKQLDRNKPEKQKEKMRSKISKIIREKQIIVSKHVNEIEALKVENIKLTSQLCEQQDAMNEMSEQIKRLEETEPVDKIKVQLQNVTEERDYLHSLLQDNIKLKIFDEEKNRYTPETRQCIMNLTSYNVSSENVGPVIGEVLKLADKLPNAIPSRKTVDNIIVEKIAVGQKQLGVNLVSKSNTCLYGDETRKFGKTYQTFLISDENKEVYFLGLRDMCDKSSSTTLDCFKNILDDISDFCEQNRKKNVTSTGNKILCNIHNFMSDRAQTNIAFNELLEQYRLEIMPEFINNWHELTDPERSLTTKINNFFCGLHLLVNFADCLSPILLLFEKMQESEYSCLDISDDDESTPIQIYSAESKTISFLRFCAKCFGRGVDEKSGCYSAFRTYCDDENEKVRFVDFRGNRFNIIFLMGQIAYYHANRIKVFFENVHGANNKLHKLTLQLVKKPYVIACCKVLGLISKLISAPLWRLIENNYHVLDLNTNYHTLLSYLDRMSHDASDFISGEDYPFHDNIIEKDKVFDKLVYAEDSIDEKACAFAQMAFKGLHSLLEKAMKEQLPGGKFFNPTKDLKDQSKSVIPHNKIPERVFGILDFFLRYRPNASTISNEAFLMFVFNKTSQWLDSLPSQEKEKLLTGAIKEGRNIRSKYKQRLEEITAARKQKLKEKQIALEKKQHAALKTKSKHTTDIIYYGLWQKTDQVDAILEEIKGVTEKRKALVSQIRFRQKVLKQVVSNKKIYQISEKGKAHSLEKLKSNVIKLIEDAGEGPGQEKPSRNIPLFVGKRVIHTFDNGKWKGQVISAVKGFPDFYNIVYDVDVEDASTPTAIYTYKLKDDYREGNLEIIPDVDTPDN